MPLDQPFSKRNRYSGTAKEITVREDAPEALRIGLVRLACEMSGWDILKLVNDTLRKLPPDFSTGNEGDRDRAQKLLEECDWFRVYDCAEAIYAHLADSASLMDVRFFGGKSSSASLFEQQLNELFVDEGIGWQLINGQIVTRGNEAFEAVVAKATDALVASERPTAAKHLHEALQDLSRRPEADLPGAVYHAMGCLECVARDLTGDSKATLGEALKRYPGLLPKPLDTALSQIWGYASNEARHVQEGRETNREEAELLVGLSAALSTYLTRKQS